MFVVLFCPTLCDSMGCSQPGSSIHGTLQARILEWVAIPFSRDQTWVSCLAGGFFTVLSQQGPHINTHTHRKTHTHTETHTHRHTDTHRYTHTQKHTIHTDTHTDTHRHTQTQIHTYTHTDTHTQRNTHIHTQTHTHRHTYTHRHTHKRIVELYARHYMIL